jgi:hypothetical protein
MTQAHDRDTGTFGQMAGLLTAHSELVSETSEAMALDIAAALEAVQAELKGTVMSPSVRKNFTRMLAALQNQDKLRQQMLVVTAGLEMVSEARLPEGVVPQDWYADRIADLQKRYVMREQVQVHDAYFNGGKAVEVVEDEIEFF